MRRLTTFALILAWLLSGCHLELGPFVPADAVKCLSDVDCHDHETCRFPGPDKHPVCMPGHNDAWLEGW